MSEDDHFNKELEQRRGRVHLTVKVCERAVVALLNDRETFRRFADAVNESAAVRQTWFPSIVARWYSQSMLIALRRLADADERTHSLRRLLEEMLAHPEAWSRDAMLQIWAADDQHKYPLDKLDLLLSGTYREFADKSGHMLNTERIRTDRNRLSKELDRVKTVVDKQIAHTERDWEPLELTFPELRSAVDVVHEMVKPYIALLTGAGFTDMTPTPQTRWWRIFDPWKSMSLFP